MNIIDLSHPIAEEMPLYPGTPVVRIRKLHGFAQDGYREKQITLTTHTGTHVDAPAHMLESGKTLDRFPLEQFFGEGVALDVSALKGKKISKSFLVAHKTVWQKADFILFFTGHDRNWGSEAYFSDFSVLTIEAVEFLLRSQKLKGIGFDTISADAMESTEYPIHRRLMGADCLIIENLTNLAQVAGQRFTFSIFPLAVTDADGFPVRAAAIMNF